jgi:hypothetical protein
MPERFTIGFLPGHSPDKNKDVIIFCLILKESINSSNKDIIITSKVFSVISILDKKMKEYDKAVNLYDNNNCCIFIKQKGIEFETPLRFYKDSHRIFEIHQEHKVKQFSDYNETGILMRQGLLFNGSFTEKVANKENKENKENNVENDKDKLFR